MLVWPSVTLFGILDANNVVFMIHTEVMKITNRRRNGPPLYLLLPPAVSRHRYCLCILQQSPPQILPPCRQRHDHHSPDADCFSPQKLRRPHFSPDGECRFYYLVRENFDRGPAGQRWVLEQWSDFSLIHQLFLFIMDDINVGVYGWNLPSPWLCDRRNFVTDS